MKITLTGQALSTQHCYKSTTANGYNRMYMAKACVDLKTAWQWEAKSQWKREVATGPVTMHITLFHGDKRNRDIDNFSKIIFDCLTGIVYEDDSQVNQLSIVKSYDKGNPRVELEILCA